MCHSHVLFLVSSCARLPAATFHKSKVQLLNFLQSYCIWLCQFSLTWFFSWKTQDQRQHFFLEIVLPLGKIGSPDCQDVHQVLGCSWSIHWVHPVFACLFRNPGMFEALLFIYTFGLASYLSHFRRTPWMLLLDRPTVKKRGEMSDLTRRAWWYVAVIWCYLYGQQSSFMLHLYFFCTASNLS